MKDRKAKSGNILKDRKEKDGKENGRNFMKDEEEDSGSGGRKKKNEKKGTASSNGRTMSPKRKNNVGFVKKSLVLT
ncbi:MAG: hypothetical protein LE168_04095 [Endomicrobium sp.]|nr:hypothetical protein [Endomicrobium sp.]